jgi:uncharacterized protein DUF4149
MSRPGVGLLAFVESCLLTLWLGAALFFAAVVAPATFAAAPAPSFAGALIGRVLPPLFASGVVVGFAIVAIELRWPRGGSRLRASAAGVMLATCAAAQFVIAGQIDRLRAAAERPIGTLERDHPRRVAFGRLHALSVAALSTAMIAAATAAAASRVPPAARS